MRSKIVVYSDLDGTVLDENYSFTEAQPIIQKLQALNTAIVLNSSKTRAEIQHYRTKLAINDPFIAENGSAIYTPENYFRTPYKPTKKVGHYDIIELGTPYPSLRQKLEAIKKASKTEIIGFGDMTTEEIAKETRLPIALAKLAKEREYDEPFRITPEREGSALQAIAAQGLCYTKGGRYYHLMGCNDKGKATKILTDIYKKEFQSIVTVGVGDGPNDECMLKLVDKPFFIKNNEFLPVWKEILEIAQTHT